MPKGETEIAYCHSCGGAMDVSAVEPFTNVACPVCGKHTRVKREFGPYTLLRRHAIGGMSLVFAAQDNTLGREVVVKILNEEYSSDERRIGAFEEEARITASISHPNVVRVFTTGRAFGRFFIAMEFVSGGHFEHHIHERGTIPESEAIPLAIETIEGLKAAHQSGLIHRDIKPGNILLDGEGRAKIVDFGLALVTQGGKATASEIWATPYYVPPETIEGQSEDFRSDMYAFGATFYHALAGKPPCDEESMDTKRLRQAKQEIKPLEKAAAWLNLSTCEVIDRCMAYDPEDRFRSYDDLIAALRQAQQEIGSAPPAPNKTVGMSRKRRRQGMGSMIALGLAVLAVVAAVGVAVVIVVNATNRPVVEPVDNSPEEPAFLMPVEQDLQGSEALEVARIYREAGAALRARDYELAGVRFSEIRDAPGVLEPTGSWAACEAVAMSYLDGDAGRARQQIGLARNHLESAAGLSEGFRRDLISGLLELQKMPPVPVTKVTDKSGTAELLAILSGLKNWEQGMLDQAEPHFRFISRASTRGGLEWLEPYVAIANDYLDDLKMLREAAPKDFDLKPDAARALIDELEEVRSSLRTKGRARFNVRCWQLELEKAMRDEPQEPSKPVVQPEDLAEIFDSCRFSGALELLRRWTPEDDSMKARRRALMLLSQSAMTFLAELGEQAGPQVGKIEMKARSGKLFVGVAGGDESGLRLIDASGSEVSLKWHEIDPGSLNELHRGLVKESASELEKIRRHEQAIAFDLLAGDAERAKSAGDRLAELSEVFKRRWEQVAPALPR